MRVHSLDAGPASLQLILSDNNFAGLSRVENAPNAANAWLVKLKASLIPFQVEFESLESLQKLGWL